MAVCAEDSQDTPWRFSYVRASNSLRRYGSKSRRAYSADDGSLDSSREDLLDHPIILSRRKRLGITKQSSKKYKSGNSSSEDLLCESDYTEEPLSSGMPETDGSVFSSQENLFESWRKCSANVSQFLHRQSFDKSRKASSIEISYLSPSPQSQESCVEFHHSSEQGKHGMDNSSPINPGQERKENYSSSDHQEELQPSSLAGDAAASEQSMCTISQPVLSDNVWVIKNKVQMAVVKTIHRLINHISNVKEQVEVLENKCIVLKETLYNLRQGHDELEVKIAMLEKRSEQSAEWYSDSNDHEYKNDNSNSVEDVFIGSLPSVEQVYRESTDGKSSEGIASCAISEPTTVITTTDSVFQDSKVNFTTVSSSVGKDHFVSQTRT